MKNELQTAFLASQIDEIEDILKNVHRLRIFKHEIKLNDKQADFDPVSEEVLDNQRAWCFHLESKLKTIKSNLEILNKDKS